MALTVCYVNKKTKKKSRQRVNTTWSTMCWIDSFKTFLICVLDIQSFKISLLTTTYLIMRFLFLEHVSKGLLSCFIEIPMLQKASCKTSSTPREGPGSDRFGSRYSVVFKRTGPRSITEFPKLVTNQTVWLRSCQASLGVRFQTFGKK